MKIQVLGTCRKCAMAYEVIERVVRETGADVELSKVEGVKEAIRLGVRTMPAIVVDGELAIKGYVPSREQVLRLIGIR